MTAQRRKHTKEINDPIRRGMARCRYQLIFSGGTVDWSRTTERAVGSRKMGHRSIAFI